MSDGPPRSRFTLSGNSAQINLAARVLYSRVRLLPSHDDDSYLHPTRHLSDRTSAVFK